MAVLYSSSTNVMNCRPSNSAEGEKERKENVAKIENSTYIHYVYIYIYILSYLSIYLSIYLSAQRSPHLQAKVEETDVLQEISSAR